MAVLNALASSLGRRDEKPNQALAAKLAAEKDTKGIAELVANLGHKDKAVQHDCIKVLYEIGYINPRLISKHTDVFLNLLDSRNNRMVWGAMIALSLVAPLEPQKIVSQLGSIKTAITKGSVITVDNGVKVLAQLSRMGGQYEKEAFPFLLDHLKSCRPKEVPQHSESTSIAINERNKNLFLKILRKRLQDLTERQKNRVEKVIRKLEVMQS